MNIVTSPRINGNPNKMKRIKYLFHCPRHLQDQRGVGVGHGLGVSCQTMGAEFRL